MYYHEKHFHKNRYQNINKLGYKPHRITHAQHQTISGSLHDGQSVWAADGANHTAPTIPPGDDQSLHKYRYGTCVTHRDT